MRYPINEVFNIAELNVPITSTIVQEQVIEGVYVFSLGEGTSMSPEGFQFYKMLFVKQGKIRVSVKDDNLIPFTQDLEKNDGLVTPKNKVIMVDALEDSVYLEVHLGQIVNHTIKEPGQVFSISEVVDFKEKSYTSTTIIKSGFVEVRIICMDECEMEKIEEHSTMIFGYEGEGEIIADGETFKIGPDTSMRFLPGTHIHLKTNSKLKLGVTNFFI